MYEQTRRAKAPAAFAPANYTPMSVYLDSCVDYDQAELHTTDRFEIRRVHASHTHCSKEIATHILEHLSTQTSCHSFRYLARMQLPFKLFRTGKPRVITPQKFTLLTNGNIGRRD